MLIMNKWKIRWVNCGCVSILAIGFLAVVGYALVIIISSANIESGLNADGHYLALQRYADRIPQWSADGQILVVNLGDEIYGASVDGNRLWQVAYKDTEHRLGGVFEPSLSVNGEVAYLKYYYDMGSLLPNLDGHYHIEMTDINGVNATEPNRLYSETGRSGAPKWSPNGSRFAFATNGPHITIMTKRESGLSSILTFWRKYNTLSIPEEGYAIFWSNDGQRLAFTESSRSSRIVNVRWNGTDKKISMEQKSSIGEFERGSLAWSTADDRIYFVYYESIDGEDVEYATSIRSVHPDGSDERIIAAWWDGFRVKDLKLSPDGSQLLFTTYRSSKEDNIRSNNWMSIDEGLFVMSADGSDAKKVFGPTSGSIDNPYRSIYASWSPSGSRIAVHYLGGGENVFTISPDGSDARVVIGPGVQPGYGKPLPEALGR